MQTTVTTGFNYWQVIDDRPEQTPPVKNLTDYHETQAEAEEAFAALPGAGRLLATHDDGRSDQFDWQLEKQKSAPKAGIA